MSNNVIIFIKRDNYDDNKRDTEKRYKSKCYNAESTYEGKSRDRMKEAKRARSRSNSEERRHQKCRDTHFDEKARKIMKEKHKRKRTNSRSSSEESILSRRKSEKSEEKGSEIEKGKRKRSCDNFNVTSQKDDRRNSSRRRSKFESGSEDVQPERNRTASKKEFDRSRDSPEDGGKKAKSKKSIFDPKYKIVTDDRSYQIHWGSSTSKDASRREYSKFANYAVSTSKYSNKHSRNDEKNHPSRGINKYVASRRDGEGETRTRHELAEKKEKHRAKRNFEEEDSESDCQERGRNTSKKGKKKRRKREASSSDSKSSSSSTSDREEVQQKCSKKSRK